MPSITGLAITTALTAVKNEIPNVSDLVKKKTDYNAKISGIEKIYFPNFDYDKFTNDIINVKIKEKKLVNKSNISGFIGNFDLNEILEKLATKAELKLQQDKIVKLKVLDSSYFQSKSQNYLEFQPIFRYLKMFW